METVARLNRFLRCSGRALSPLLILTHDHPDPDAIASAYALAHLAKHLGKVRSRIAHGGIVGRIENQTMVRVLDIPLHRFRPALDLKRFRAVALVDTQPGFGNHSFPKEAKAALVVDHHPPPAAVPRPAGFSCIDSSAGATSVLLVQAMIQAHCSIPVPLATALAYGLISETQDLGRETRGLEIKIYREIIPRCDLRLLALIQNPQRPDEFFRTLKRSLDRAFVAGPIIGAHLGTVRTPDLVSQTADFLLTYEGMRWSFCTGRFQDRLFVSLRSLRPVRHAGRLLQKVLEDTRRAGGHPSMAGGSIPVGTFASGAVWRRAEHRVARRLISALDLGRHRLRLPFRE